MPRSFLKVTGWRTLFGFVKLILKHTARWSPERLPFVSPRHGSETVGIPINKELTSRVMTRVVPIRCLRRPSRLLSEVGGVTDSRKRLINACNVSGNRGVTPVEAGRKV